MAFDPTKIGSEFIYTDRTVSAAPAQGNQVCAYNPYRVSVMFQATGGNVAIRPNASAVAGGGITLVGGGVPTIFTLSQHGPLVQQAWNCGTAGAVNIYVLETLWQPPGGNL
jgi:hypothetical protein